jgi:membrane-bound lytic murein transglycosylase D
LSSWTAHKVTAARERIESIAARFKTTPELIREVNAIPPNMHPKAGSTVLVPKPSTDIDKDIGQEVADNAMLAYEPDEPPRRKITIRAGKRDTVASIAARYKVKPEEVRDWNNLKNDKLTAGQSLRLEVRAGRSMANRGKGNPEPNTPKKTAGKSEKASESRRISKSDRRTGKPEKVASAKHNAKSDKETHRQPR